MAERSLIASSPAVALASWLLPGAGYMLIGEFMRGLTIGLTILCLFVTGVLIAGIRVIDVPGYDNLGFEVRLKTAALVRGGEAVGQRLDPWDPRYFNGQLALTSRPLGEIINKPWYVGQVLAGPICLLASKLSIAAARPANLDLAAKSTAARVSRVQPSHARIAEIGSLYTAIAGMLNLLAIIDSASRAGRKREEQA